MPDVVQRWRIVHGRGPSTRDLAQRPELEAWEAAVLGSGLPVLLDGRGRPKLGVSIPLPVGYTARAELLDLPLVARRTAPEVRQTLVAAAPPDHPIVEVSDVWVGSPALAASVIAADYAVTIASDAPDARLVDAARSMLEADALPRTRRKGDRSVDYDLRPLVSGILVADRRVAMRVVVHPTLGVGRPDEVVGAIADAAGVPVTIVEGIRERLVLAGDRV